jgi:hypothetical protein
MRTNERQFGAFPQFVTLCLSVRRLVFPRSVVKKQNQFPRDDLVLAAMNDGCNVSSASRLAEQAQRPPARDRAATLASPCRHGDPKLPDPRASRMVPSVSPINSGKPSSGPQICHSATMSSVSVDANSGSDKDARRVRA